MIKVGICGVAGRMGQRISHLTLEAEIWIWAAGSSLQAIPR